MSDNVLDLSDLLSLPEAIEYSGLTKQRLYQLRDRLGVEVRGVWFYSKAAIDSHLATRNPKGGRPAGKDQAAMLAQS